AAPDECHARHDSDEQRSPRRKSRKAQGLSLSDAKEKQSGTGGKEDAARGVKAADLGSPAVGEGAQSERNQDEGQGDRDPKEASPAQPFAQSAADDRSGRLPDADRRGDHA